MRQKPLFITGIGTGVGKTITSAIIVEKLKADYWKPVQSGDLNHTDTDRVRSLVSNSATVFHPESYRLTQPFSPHKSAKFDNVTIDLNSIELPLTDNQLIIEGAGGLMVPLNDRDLMIDLIQKFNAEVILVSQNYLGSINHTLLSIEALKSRNITINRLVICGKQDISSEEAIKVRSDLKTIYIPEFEVISNIVIREFAESLIY